MDTRQAQKATKGILYFSILAKVGQLKKQFFIFCPDTNNDLPFEIKLSMTLIILFKYSLNLSSNEKLEFHLTFFREII